MLRWLLFLMLLILCLPAGAISPQEREEQVLARALVKGETLAAETWLAQTRQSAQQSLYLNPRLSLRPLSIVLTHTPWERQEETLLLLLKLGAHFNYQEPDLDMKTPLHLALDSPTENQASALIRIILLHHGRSNLILRDRQGRTPAQYARETFPALSEILENFRTIQFSPLDLGYQATAWVRGERILIQLRQEQALFEAIEKLNVEQLQTLLQQGTSPTARSLERQWETPLHRLLRHPEQSQAQPLLEILCRLEAAREAPDGAGNRPIHLAAALGHLPALQILAKTGASLEARNLQGETAVMRAVISGQSEALRWLNAQGAQLNRPDTQGLTPLELLQSLLARPNLPLELRGRLLHTESVLKELLQRSPSAF